MLKVENSPTAFVLNLPLNDALVEKTRYYYDVSNKHWKDGVPQRMRMKPERARRIARQIDYIVCFSSDQTGGSK